MEEEKDKENPSVDGKKELEECEKQKEDYLAGWKRERADFLNFKRDESERIQRIVQSSESDILKTFLPIIDNMHLLEKHIPKDADDSWLKGFKNIQEQIAKFLEKSEIKEIDCINKEFDPNLHEAVEVIAGEQENPTVVEEVQKGYIMKGKVLRPAKVKVANKLTK
jgi:molecular chaperone GrpE